MIKPMLAPWENNTHRLWSLWDMLTLDARNFVQLLHTLLNNEMQMRSYKGPASPEFTKITDGVAEYLIEIMTPMDLPHSIKVARNMLMGCDDIAKMHKGFEHLANSVMLELEGRKFYGPLRSFEKYYDHLALFGEPVFNNFPSANDDIYEAGMCLALERATACVMHLMRVLEIGLGALAKAVGVEPQNDWGAYLRKIQEELDRRAKSSGARSPDEQFYAEAAVSFDRLRRAFRNPTMHPDKSYSQERAEEILLSTKSFMAHLATRLSE